MQSEKCQESEISAQLDSLQNVSSNRFPSQSEQSHSLKLLWSEDKGHKDNPDNQNPTAQNKMHPQSSHSSSSDHSSHIWLTKSTLKDIKQFLDTCISKKIQEHIQGPIQEQNNLMKKIRKFVQFTDNTTRMKEQSLENRESEQRHKFTKQEKKKFIKLLSQGVTRRKVCEIAKITERTLRRWIQLDKKGEFKNTD